MLHEHVVAFEEFLAERAEKRRPAFTHVIQGVTFKQESFLAGLRHARQGRRTFTVLLQQRSSIREWVLVDRLALVEKALILVGSGRRLQSVNCFRDLMKALVQGGEANRLRSLCRISRASSEIPNVLQEEVWLIHQAGLATCVERAIHCNLFMVSNLPYVIAKSVIIFEEHNSIHSKYVDDIVDRFEASRIDLERLLKVPDRKGTLSLPHVVAANTRSKPSHAFVQWLSRK